MRNFVILVLALVLVAGAGCSQMRYAGRYQEVKIESEPPGASVLVEGKINVSSPAGFKAEDGTELAYSSPMQLTTPVVLILDKEVNDYHIRIACDGYPEYETNLSTRFAFHPYLIITFPVVPFWSDYEIKRFDNVFVDFQELQEAAEEGKKEFAAEVKKKIAETEEKLRRAEEELEATEEELEAAGEKEKAK